MIQSPVHHFEYKGWSFTSTTTRISNSEEIENIQQETRLPSVPDMIFGNNLLTVSHVNGWQITFSALDVLKKVDTKNVDVKVSVAEEWLGVERINYYKHLEQNDNNDNEDNDFQVIRPFDWTYTPKGGYQGSCNRAFNKSNNQLNMQLLLEKEEILYYSEVILYEDELGDHGFVTCSVKIRVMPSCFFILFRFALRVDEVIYRIYETRIQHEFNKSTVIREIIEKECDFEVAQTLNTNLTNMNTLANEVPIVTKYFEESTIN